jgi:hypothetical protein
MNPAELHQWDSDRPYGSGQASRVTRIPQRTLTTGGRGRTLLGVVDEEEPRRVRPLTPAARQQWIPLDHPDYPGVSAVQLETIGGRLTVTGVQVQRSQGVRADDLKVPVERLEAALAAQFRSDRERVSRKLTAAWESTRQAPTRRELRVRTPKGGRYPDQFYAAVAALYMRLVAAGEQPTPAIAEANDLPETTVHRWIREARRRGFLPPGQRGRAG